jgi:very-short-patch-repair endonuclease
LDLVEDGCHSELELWGHRAVFTGQEFASFGRQVPRRLLGRTAYLDMFDSQAALDIELDGRKYHSSVRQREADLARDAAAAEEGIQTLRFSHERLTGDPAGCRRQAMLVRRRRMQQLHGHSDTTPVWGRATG